MVGKIKLYNSLTRKKEVFKPQNTNRVTMDGPRLRREPSSPHFVRMDGSAVAEPSSPHFVRMYTCGPTVYDHTHVGHMRTYVNTDVLRRVLEYNGFEVKQVMNVTDVGHLFGDRDLGKDKLEEAAKMEKKSAWEIAREYEKEFFETLAALNIEPPAIVCRATEHIQEMVSLIQKIEKAGYTYLTSDGIYFDTSELKDYNRLSGMPLAKLREGARVEKNPEKKNPTDFALWKFSPKTGPRRQMEWDSPWGVGFPGWHIECSAMGMKYLGEAIDLHTGGLDHRPIHHTNERAQNFVATGKEVVRFWVHNAFLLVEGQKMSKSLKNFFWLKDVLDRDFDPLALRYLFLTAHYRNEMNFTWAGLEAAAIALEKLYNELSMWDAPGKVGWTGSATPSNLATLGCAEYESKFEELINDDLNLPEAVALMWRLVKDQRFPTSAKMATLLKMDRVFGLKLSEVEEVKVPEEVLDLVRKRERARREENWSGADELRDRIEQAGFRVEDMEKGPVVHRVREG
ncbi:MAG: cysteine--tRNA ligase [candidate division WWE3 bacterium]|nr:cysteine--tRNA ligase [candidate division WWE3 bacterium]